VQLINLRGRSYGVSAATTQQLTDGHLPGGMFRPQIKQFLLQTAILLAPDTGTTTKIALNVPKSHYISFIYGLVYKTVT